MPTYAYRCNNPKCAQIFDIWGKKFEDAAKDDRCPECGILAKRQFSLPAAIIIN